MYRYPAMVMFSKPMPVTNRKCCSSSKSMCPRCARAALNAGGEGEAAPGVSWPDLGKALGVEVDPGQDPVAFNLALKEALDSISATLGGAPQIAEGDLATMEDDEGNPICPDGWGMENGECVKPKRREGPTNPPPPAGNAVYFHNEADNVLPQFEVDWAAKSRGDYSPKPPRVATRAGRGPVANYGDDSANLLPSSRVGPLDAKLADIERERRERQARRRGWAPEAD